MDAFLKDLKHSARMFLQTPSFTIAAIAALALGIGPKTAVLAYAFWQRRFGGEPKVIGRRMTLNGERYEIIGVAGSNLKNGQISEMMRGNGDVTIEEPPDVYIPFQLDPNSADHGHFFNVAGRLKPGVTLAVADAQVQASYPEYARWWPDDYCGCEGFGGQPLTTLVCGCA